MEDQLTHDERLRLECFAQAVAICVPLGIRDETKIVEKARVIEAYVGGQTNG